MKVLNYFRLLLIQSVCSFFIFPFACGEWIEISQNAVVSYNDSKRSNKHDFKAYLATTTSTTQTSVITKSSVVQKNGTKRKMHNTIKKEDKLNTITKNDNIEKQTKEAEVESEGNGGFFSYLSSIQNTLVKSTDKAQGSKIAVLRNLRDHLLLEIEDRIGSLWHAKSEGRGAREHKEVDFPSNEGALLTIGFLTFAVFLIKLVLHLIQVIGHKYENGATATYYGRSRRSITNEQLKILDLLEKFDYN